MADAISAKSGAKALTLARLKVSGGASSPAPSLMSASEQKLTDILDIGQDVTRRAEKARKLDLYLRVFNSALQYYNGQPSSYRPQFSRVDIEYFQPQKIDKSV